MTSAVLNPIGKGQITIPAAWRKKIGIDRKSVIAEFNEEKMEIVLKPLKTEPEWDVEQIALNDLSKEDQRNIKVARKRYKEGNLDSFLSFEEVFGE